MLNGSAQNGKFYFSIGIVDPVHRNSVLKMSLRCIPAEQRIALSIDEETHLTWRRSYGSVASVEFSLFRCVRDDLHAVLFRAERGRPSLTISQPFDRKNLALVEIYFCLLQITSGSWNLFGVRTQDARRWNNVLADEGTDYGRRCSWG